MAIVETRQILQSENEHGDAVMGNGVYLTKLGPLNTRYKVAKNNFDGLLKQWKDKVQDGKTEIVFEMKLPKDKVQNHTNTLNRDVYLHPGNIYFIEVRDVAEPSPKDGEVKIKIAACGICGSDIPRINEFGAYIGAGVVPMIPFVADIDASARLHFIDFDDMWVGVTVGLNF